jgi:hypothetical protein
MANNRYYLLCPCGEKQYLGKSLGSGIYNNSTQSGTSNSRSIARHEGLPVMVPAPTNEPEGSGYGQFLKDIYEWMWEHLMDCPHPDATEPDSLGPEWVSGEIFKVVTE